MVTRKKTVSPYAAPVGSLIGGIIAGSVPTILDKLDPGEKLPQWVEEVAPAVLGLALVVASGASRPGLAAAGNGMLAVTAAQLVNSVLEGNSILSPGDGLSGPKINAGAGRLQAYMQQKRAAQGAAQMAVKKSLIQPLHKEESKLTRSGVIAMSEALGCN